MLKVKSVRQPVLVYNDTTLLGETPLSQLFPAGRHIIRFASPGKDWNTFSVAETIMVQPGDTLVRNIAVPTYYSVTSEPYGAQVIMNDSVIGSTPFLLVSTTETQSITLVKEEYEPENIFLSPDLPHVHILLKPQPEKSLPRSYLSNPKPYNDTPIYLSTAATILGGITAAYCKVKADNLYAEYQQTGDASLISRVKSYDTASGIALGLSEAGLVFLSYLLLSR